MHPLETMKTKENFKIVYSDECIKFLNSLDKKAKTKILYDINKSKYVIDKTLFKKIDNIDDIWEFRTLYNGTNYRIFAFWDTMTETLVLTTHGIIKKTQKISRKEIDKAASIKAAYFNAKK